jgi:hypothetical protein
VIAAQEAAQAKASDPATNVSQDPFEAKVIREEAEKSGTSTAAERIVRQAELATPKPWRGTPVHSGEIVRVADIGANPERFQFRLDYGEGGQTSDRPVIEKWNPDLGKGVWVWQDKAGKMWVADGHHRLARAKKLGVEDMSVELYREADGVSAEQIRALAALKNISQPGGAKAIDVMEFVALHPQKAKALEDAGVPMTLASVAKGIRLANLPQVARREVIKGDLPEGKAAIVGDAFGKNQDIGFEMLKGLRNNKRWQRMTEPQFEVLARMLTEIASKAGPAKKAQAGLFGAIPADYALEDKAELVGSLTSAMRKEVSVLRLASKPRHQDSLKSYGNIIKAQSNLEAAGRLEELADIIDREVTLVGPVSSAVVEALKAKMPLEQARQHVLAAASKLAPSLPSGVKPPSPPEALPEIPVPKAGDVPPRPPTPETTPHTEFPKETADLAKLESLAASVAGAARGPYRMLCELKGSRSKRSLKDVIGYLDAAHNHSDS